MIWIQSRNGGICAYLPFHKYFDKAEIGSCAIGMLLFMMIPALTPLNATIMNPILCLAGGALFSVGLGALGTFALGKSDLV